ncbi:hypothetical protein scyTo_0022143, partial [Scyliorhinus torazame]|nr:hypothetical protein [Scyliorhinus torazame]
VIKQQKEAFKLPIPSPQASKPAPTDPTVLIGGVSIKLKQGDITQEITDAIVNSTNTTLDLNSGVSGAILNAAGSSVQDECKALGQQLADGVAITNSGQLQCKYIVHIVGPKSAAGITASVHKALEECEKRSITTIAFPAIGTGKGGISCLTAINAVFSGMENYFLTIVSSNIKAISIVAFESYVYDSFADAFEAKKLNSGVGTMGTAQMTQHIYTQTAQKGGLLPTQLRIRNVIVEVQQGNITLQSVKGIVNSTNTTLDLNS